MARSGSLYPRIDPQKGYTSASDVIDSSNQNVRDHEEVDQLKERCLKFVQGIHFDPDVEATRTGDGLPSLVADETLAVFKTLDGYARKSRINVDFSPLGNDDYEGAKLRTAVFSASRSASGLAMRQAEAYGNAAILSEAFTMVYPQPNIRGELEPCVHNLLAFEGYPDRNCKDPIWMSDARFFDVRVFMPVEQILEELGPYLSEEDKQEIGQWTPDGAGNKTSTRNQATDRSGATQDHRDGMPLILKRFYRVNQRSVLYLVDEQEGGERRIEPGELESDPYLAAIHRDPAMQKTLGMRFDKQDEEWIWCCYLIPAINTEKFYFNGPCDFQPIDPRTRKKRFPVIRLPHLYVGGKIMGAIQTILKIQEYRNLILSAFVHHVQTAANGAMGYEKGAFASPTEETKFKEKRNRANMTLEFAPMGPDKRKPADKIFVLPKGEWAFKDGGDLIEAIFKDIIQKVTGATPIVRGEAQQGSPASLYKQQTEQADTNMQGTTDLYKEYQYACADLFNNFHQQFFTEERWLEIEGPTSDPVQMVINQQTAYGIVNDITQGLYAVRKVDAAPTESARRQRLADNLEVVQALVTAQLPAFLVDFESVIENQEMPESRRQQFLMGLQQWRAAQGLVTNAQATSGAQVAEAQASEAGAQSAVNQEIMRTAAQPGAGMPMAPAPSGGAQSTVPAFAGA